MVVRVRVSTVVALLLCADLVRAAIPGATDRKAYTYHDYNRDELAFNRRTIVEMYHSVGRRDPKWDGQAIAFLDAMCLTLTNQSDPSQYRVKPDQPLAEVEKLGKAARDAGCDDPLVTYCYGFILSQLERPAQHSEPLLRQAARELMDSRYPVNRAAEAAHRAFLALGGTDPAQRNAAWEHWRDLALALATSFEFKEDVERRFVLGLYSDWFRAQGGSRERAFVEAMSQQDGIDPWLMHVIRGRHEVTLAWASRRSGAGGSVTDATLQQFQEHMARARTHFEAAWELTPALPEPAEGMVTVAMAQGDRTLVEQRRWFERAVTTHFDYAPAYAAYKTSLLPRWHGSHERMYDFGVECAETARFDTRVPLELVTSLEQIATEQRSPTIWQRPGVYDTLKPVLEGAAAAQPLAGEADLYRSYLAGVAWRAGRFDDARELFDALGPRIQTGVFARMDVMSNVAISHAYAMVPGTKDLIGQADDQARSGDIAGAIATFAKAQATLPEDHKGLTYLLGRTKQLRWRQAFENGEWVDIQPDKDLSGWLTRHGQWHVDDAGGLVGTYEESGLLLLCQAFSCSNNFVVEANVELYESRADGGVAITPELTRFSGLWVRQRRGGASVVRDLRLTQAGDVTLQPTNQLRLVFADSFVTGELNGQRVFDSTDARHGFYRAKTYVGVGGRWGEKGAKVRFTGLRIKRLEKE